MPYGVVCKDVPDSTQVTHSGTTVVGSAGNTYSGIGTTVLCMLGRFLQKAEGPKATRGIPGTGNPGYRYPGRKSTRPEYK
eukprot:1082952-Rhodomonas_salina.1